MKKTTELQEQPTPKKERNYNIDFLRGVATIFIVLIHTAFWSGTLYLPYWFTNICLLIDVPVFMFISGISFTYVKSIIKNLKGLIIQWKKWLYFLLFYLVILLVFFREQFVLKDIFFWPGYAFPTFNNIQVVAGSIWFMPMYIKVTLLCSIIICAINHFAKEKELDYLKIVLAFIFFIFIFNSTGTPFLFIDSFVSFYSFVYILGYILHNYKIKGIKQLLLYELITIVLTICIFRIYGYTMVNIQDVKFPPSVPFFPFAMISILLFWYLKDHLKIKASNKINYIGQNAIFFYFAQNVSSSFIYYVYKFIPFDNIVFVFISMLICNIICTIIMGIVLTESYKFITTRFKFTKVKEIFLPEKSN